jgi:hypothetical protein
MKLADLSNEALLSDLRGLIGEGRRLLARLIAYLGEVEERRLIWMRRIRRYLTIVSGVWG